MSPDFERFYALATENRALQAQLLEIVGTGIREGKASGERQSPEYLKTVNAWNETLAKYNTNISEMNRLTEQIVKPVRKGR